jgi:predicted nucleic acid-binding protein
MSSLIQIFGYIQTGLADIERTLALKEKYGYSWWDSLLLASSLETECEILYSEDMQGGQVIEETLVICNPFVLEV